MTGRKRYETDRDNKGVLTSVRERERYVSVKGRNIREGERVKERGVI